jgi:methionine-rich copper-binding protein CopC
MKTYRSLFLMIFVTMDIGLLLVTLQSVVAHAMLRRSDPAADAVLDSSPSEAVAWFSQALSTGSHLSVFDAQFRPVDKGATFIDASDATLMRIQLNALSPGRYTVNWKANSVDGHESSGAYDFFVRESPSASLNVIIGGVGLLIALMVMGFLLVKNRRRSGY